MANNLGDFDLSAAIHGKFVSCRADTGAPATLTSGALSVYKDNSTTQSTTGVTFSGDFDSVTGFNHFTIDTSADGTFYSAGSFFDVVVTTGTVNSVSAVGSCVGQFTIQKSSALKPTTAGRKLDVSAGGEAGVDWANVGSPTTTLNLSGTTTKEVTDVETTLATIAGYVDTEVAAIKTQTDKMVFTVANQLDVNVKSNAGTAITAAAGVQEVKVATVANNAITAASLAADAGAEIADAILDRDMSTGTDSGSTSVRTPRQALRVLRNKVSIASSTLTVTKEDDSTSSWTAAVTTNPAAEPVTAIDPAGP